MKSSLTSYDTVILAAGIGKRMLSRTPKIMHKILGKPMILFVVELAHDIGSIRTILIIGKNTKSLKNILGKSVEYSLQPIPLGTADALSKGITQVTSSQVLVLCGDVPLLQVRTVMNLINYYHRSKADLALLTCRVNNPEGYGRIIRDRRNTIQAIVEQSDVTKKQQKIKEINAGVYFGKTKDIASALNSISAVNKQGEYYLTDIVTVMLKKRKRIVGLETGSEDEIMGINTKSQLARAREIVKRNWFESLMLKGVYIEDPVTTSIDLSVHIGRDVCIRPFSLIEGKTRLKDGTTVGPFTWIEDNIVRKVMIPRVKKT